MIISMTGEDDIFSSRMQTLVCPVNTVGTMGAGLALQFKRRFSELERFYQEACYKRVFEREGILIYNLHENTSVVKKILCMPTKRHWKRPSRIEWLDESLQLIQRDWKSCGIESLAIPAIGCGNGQLDWDDVEYLIRLRLEKLPIDIELYPPKGWVADSDFEPDRAVREER